MCVLLSYIQLFVILWTIVLQASLSMGFFRQEYWSRFPFPSPGDLPDPGLELVSPALKVDSLPADSLGIVSLLFYKFGVQYFHCYSFLHIF